MRVKERTSTCVSSRQALVFGLCRRERKLSGGLPPSSRLSAPWRVVVLEWEGLSHEGGRRVE
eukprot:scaffold194982_cov24-Tisochrysis_lutea.AAC.1